MQQTRMPSGLGKVALVCGLIFGGIIGLIDIVYTAILDAANPPFLAALYQVLSPLMSFNTIVGETVFSFIVSIPLYVLLFVCFLLAGLFAARKTHKALTGMLAGLWVGVIYLVIDLLIANILLSYFIVFPQDAHLGMSAAELASFEQSTLVFSISYSLITGLILIGLGLGISALGGLIGRGKATPFPTYVIPNQFSQGQMPPR